MNNLISITQNGKTYIIPTFMDIHEAIQNIDRKEAAFQASHPKEAA